MCKQRIEQVLSMFNGCDEVMQDVNKGHSSPSYVTDHYCQWYWHLIFFPYPNNYKVKNGTRRVDDG
jgi:hypothetical protein